MASGLSFELLGIRQVTVSMNHHSEVIIDVLRRRPSAPRSGVEIGVQSGNTSVAMLQAFPTLTLYMVDPWAVPPEDGTFLASGDPVARQPFEQFEAAYIRTKQRVQFAGARAKIFRSTSEEAATGFSDESLDFVFVDGSHHTDDVFRDAKLWWPKLSTGGVLFFHDYQSTASWAQGVTPAVDEFAAFVHRTLTTGEKTVAWLTK